MHRDVSKLLDNPIQGAQQEQAELGSRRYRPRGDAAKGKHQPRHHSAYGDTPAELVGCNAQPQNPHRVRPVLGFAHKNHVRNPLEALDEIHEGRCRLQLREASVLQQRGLDP